MVAGKRTPLAADDWIDAATEALARDGLSGIAVEPLARKVGATKGSFYWHFADRAALLQSVLDRWEQQHTEQVISFVDTETSPTDRLRTLLRVAISSAHLTDSAQSIDLVLQASTSHPAIAAAVKRVNTRRLSYLTGLFTDAGMTADAARERALLAYMSYLGNDQLAHATPDLVPTGEAFEAFIDHVIELLIPKPE